MQSPRTMRVLVVANRTAATPWLLQEVEHRSQTGACEIALLIPPTGARRPDWTLEVALPLFEKSAGRHVEGLECGSDCFAAVRRALSEQQFDEVLISTRPARGPRWLRRDLIRRIDGLGVPVTTVVPGKRATLDRTVLKIRWDDGGP